MSISKNDVVYIAALARIHLPEDQIDPMAKSLDKIVHYIEQLQSLNVDHVHPTTHAVPVGNVWREDVVKPSLSNQDALSIAVDKAQGSFKVPLVIE